MTVIRGCHGTRVSIHFKPRIKRPEDYEKQNGDREAGFISQGADGIVKARVVEDQLMRDTWDREPIAYRSIGS